MVTYLNDVVYEGDVTHEGLLVANGGSIVGPGGSALGDLVDNWPAHTRVQVADVTERAAVVAWRAANAPISATAPLLVWRADGSLTGVNEITVDGVNWYAETPLAGDIELTLATTAPYGWMLMQGQILASAATNYPALWANASPSFRSGGSLILPDMRGRAPIGAGQGTGLTLRNLGDQLGAESVVITEAQLALHSHSIAHGHPGSVTDTEPAHNHDFTTYKSEANDHDHNNSGSPSWAAATDDGTAIINTDSDGAHSHSVTVAAASPAVSGSKGNNEAHPNVQPSLVLNFKVKV